MQPRCGATYSCRACRLGFHLGLPRAGVVHYALGMCMLLIGQDVHPEYKLIIAANRDEDVRRPTEEAHWWNEPARILAGRDVTAGGTWLGINRQGRLAALTNYWGDMQTRPDAPSRGGLVSGFLRSSLPAPDYVRRMEELGEGHPGAAPDGRAALRSRYNGFNLIMGSVDELWYYTNAENVKSAGPGFRPPAVGEAQPLKPGIHTLSNAVLNSPWPKAEQAAAMLRGLISSSRLGPHSLMDLLNTSEDESLQQDPLLPREKARELAKSSIRIRFPRFATRSSTVVLVDRSNRVRFIERTYSPARVNDFSFRASKYSRPFLVRSSR